MSKEIVERVQRDLDYRLSSQDELHSIEEEFVHNGWILTSWNTLSDGNGEQIDLEETINPSEDKHLYAQWKRTSPNEVVFKSTSEGLSACYFSEQIPKHILTFQNSKAIVQKPYSYYINGCISSPNTVEEIVDYGEQVSSIGAYSLCGCTNLTDIYAPNVEKINNYSFYRCNISSAIFPKVKTIGEYAFYGTKLTSLNISSVESIGNFAFQNQTGLISLDLPHVSSVNFLTFDNCTNITYINIPEITSIGSYGFWYCPLSKMDFLRIPNVRIIGQGSFSGTNLLSIDATQLTSVDSEAFLGSKKLSCIYVNNSRYHSIDNGFGDNNSFIVDSRITSLVAYAPGINRLKNSTIKTVSGTLAYLNTIKYLYLPELTSASYMAFYHSQLEYIYAPKLQQLGYATFAGCGSLKTIILSSISTIPNGRSFMYESSPHASNTSVFLSCGDVIDKFMEDSYWGALTGSPCYFKFIPVVKNVNFYDGDTLISTSYNCFINTSVIPPDPPEKFNYEFDGWYTQNSGGDRLESIVVEQSTNYYMNIYAHYNFVRDQESIEFKTTSEEFVDIKANDISSSPLVYSNSNGEIQEPFYDYPKIDSPEKIVSIDDQFEYISAIGDYSFTNCINLEIANIPNVKQIGLSSFNNCNKLTSLILSSNSEVVDIDPRSFINCSNVYVVLSNQEVIDKFLANDNWNALTSTIISETGYGFKFIPVFEEYFDEVIPTNDIDPSQVKSLYGTSIWWQ